MRAVPDLPPEPWDDDCPDVDVAAILAAEEATQPATLPPARGTAQLRAVLDGIAPRERHPRRGWATTACSSDPDPDRWFPEMRGRNQRVAEERARTVCRRCPSRVACLLDALALEEPTTIRWGGGVWGGASGRDRMTLLDAMAASPDASEIWEALADGADPFQVAETLRDDRAEAA